jgi:hypothetical protein
MSQEDLVLSLHEEGLTAKKIHERLVESFDPLAMPYSIVTRTIRKISWTASEDRSENFGGRAPNLDHDAWILSVLERESETRYRGKLRTKRAFRNLLSLTSFENA